MVRCYRPIPQEMATGTTTLLELASNAVERAEGPSRELDCLIDVAVGNPVHNPHGPSEVANWPQRANGLTVPAYTSSLDAAMMLVPEGWSLAVNHDETRRHSTARLGRSYPTNAAACSENTTPALALAAAALRARGEA